MANELPPQVLNVYAVDEETEDETRIGKVQYHPDGRLALLEAEPDQEGFLANVVESMNAKDVLIEKIPPPPGAEKRSTHSKVHKRDDADYFGALQDYLLKYYGLSLG